MSQKHSYTTADYLPWDTAMALVRKLYQNGNYRASLLLGCGFFFGLRASDLRKLSWDQILHQDEFVVYEQKTGKRRIIRINKGFQRHIGDCHTAMNIKDDSRPCFLNKFGSPISLQMINREFKTIRSKYQLKISNFSTHTMRKTWARKIWEVENAEGRGEQALTVLSEIMNHSSPAITRRYICLRQKELNAVWEDLFF